MAVLFARFSLCSACRWLRWAIFTHREKCLNQGGQRLFDQSLCEISQGHQGSRCLWTVIKRVILTLWPHYRGRRGGFGYVSVCQRRSDAWLSLTGTQNEGKASCWLDVPSTSSCMLYLILSELNQSIFWIRPNSEMIACTFGDSILISHVHIK